MQVRGSEQAWARSEPLTCLALAGQGLRTIHPFHGRPNGDKVLQDLIENVKPLLDANDERLRIGGSEVLLPLWDQLQESARSSLAMNAGVSPSGARVMEAGSCSPEWSSPRTNPTTQGSDQVVVR